MGGEWERSGEKVISLEEVCRFLKSLGVEAEEDPLLPFIAAREEERLCNETNQPEVVKGLEQLALYRAAGQYLRLKKDSGQLQAETLTLEMPEKQIQEGDTQITYAVEAALSPEQRLEQLIGFLLGDHAAEIARYRRLLF